jgi:DNA helicase-2/ATP-dependent DNA helicase PcrA
MVDFSGQFSTMVDSMLNMETLWKLNKFKPNDQQKDAILHVDGPLFITAGPGSGKTRVLLWRTLNLIVFHNVKPEEIFLSTFTEKAAHQLKEGLRAILGYVTNINGQPYDLSRMYIGTIHSLCRRMLNDRRKFLQDYHNNPTPSLMDELGQYFHVSKRKNWQQLTYLLDIEDRQEQNTRINQIFEKKSGSRYEAVTRCIAFFNRCSEEMIDPDLAIEQLAHPDSELVEFLDAHGLEPEEIILAFRLYQVYQHTLVYNEKLRNTDFSLLQQDAYRLLMTRDESAQVFKHVIIDEYQDTNTIQEKLIFRLAEGSKNICVVGDDDQALYRFRGATVENFVDFPIRCLRYLQVSPTRISLSINYRSRRQIVDFYTDFIDRIDWRRIDRHSGFFRVVDKHIQAFSKDDGLSVVATTPQPPEAACAEIAILVRDLIDSGKVEDPNQIAFLYPSLKTQPVETMKTALENVGLRVYAPRAGRFLEVEEAMDVFGAFSLIFSLPEVGNYGGDYQKFVNWLNLIDLNGKQLARQDPNLRQFIEDKRAEIARVCKDYLALKQVIDLEGWSLQAPYEIERMSRKLYNTSGFSPEGKKLLGSTYLERLIRQRIADDKPYTLDYILKRVTSLDWSVLDLFYRLTGFEHFKNMFDLAERGEDEGPICNLGLITQYLARFTDEFIPMMTANLIVDGVFHITFYFSFLFSLFRRGESEYEDAEDPFPKGRIPFLTIHQAKGLEFPVVVLGNPRRNLFQPGFIERSLYRFCDNEDTEPLDRQAEFDNIRMFYVALSRAQNLMVLAHFKGPGYTQSEPFRTILKNGVPRIPELDLTSIPAFKGKEEELPRMYSYTSDFLLYKKCPRQYMIFRKYGFVPSRAQTMFFGSLVHRTLEDLHHEIIRCRGEVTNGS